MNFLREHAYDLRHASSKKLQLLALRAGAQPEDVAEAMTEEVAVGDRTTKLLSLVMELGVHTLFTPERTPEREAMPSGVRYEPTMPTLSPHQAFAVISIIMSVTTMPLSSCWAVRFRFPKPTGLAHCRCRQGGAAPVLYRADGCRVLSSALGV